MTLFSGETRWNFSRRKQSATNRRVCSHEQGGNNEGSTLLLFHACSVCSLLILSCSPQVCAAVVWIRGDVRAGVLDREGRQVFRRQGMGDRSAQNSL